MKRHMRNAFSMITAIFVIVIMATIGMLISNVSGKTVKTTTAQYQRAQAELYAKSYTEFAVMAVTAHNRIATGNCVDTITADIGNPSNGSGYKVEVYVSYIGDANNIVNCARQLGTSTTPKTPLSIIVDAYVRFKDPDNTTGMWMSVHRRTIQKI